MRVLLISANTEQINMPVLPVGLASVAAATEKAGHDVKLVNLMTNENVSAVLANAIAESQPEAIGISVRNIDDQSMQTPRFLLDPVKEVVAGCRRLSGAPVILGGAGFSIFPQSALTYLGADMGICGEGEQAFVQLLERLSRGQDLSGVPGLVLPDGGPATASIRPADLDALPLPTADGVLSFPTTFNGQQIWLPFQTRRGCPMNCSYCSTATIEGKLLRKRSPALVVESLAQFAETGFTHVFFVDNTFNLPPSYARELCNRLVARKLGITWRCILYPWKVDEELVENMARAGCVEVAFGFESGSSAILKSMNKRFQPEEVRSIAEMLKSHGIKRMGFLLLGGPGETHETVLESLAFADSLHLEAMKVTVGIRIYPHTALARTALREGVIQRGQELLFPTFYLAKGLNGWLQETVKTWVSQRPNWHTG
jgi:radical SAM superfamily enzyme YgiQ (UPF0313 family)